MVVSSGYSCGVADGRANRPSIAAVLLVSLDGWSDATRPGLLFPSTTPCSRRFRVYRVLAFAVIGKMGGLLPLVMPFCRETIRSKSILELEKQ